MRFNKKYIYSEFDKDAATVKADTLRIIRRCLQGTGIEIRPPDLLFMRSNTPGVCGINVRKNVVEIEERVIEKDPATMDRTVSTGVAMAVYFGRLIDTGKMSTSSVLDRRLAINLSRFDSWYLTRVVHDGFPTLIYSMYIAEKEKKADGAVGSILNRIFDGRDVEQIIPLAKAVHEYIVNGYQKEGSISLQGLGFPAEHLVGPTVALLTLMTKGYEISNAAVAMFDGPTNITERIRGAETLSRYIDMLGLQQGTGRHPFYA